MLTVTALAVMLWSGNTLYQFLDRKIEKISVDGGLHYITKREISERVRNSIEAEPEAGFLSIDLEPIQQQLIQEPWLEQVTLRRRWPDQLNVEVVERIPVAHWNNGALMTKEAAVFVPDKLDIAEQLPSLSGPEASAGQLWRKFRYLEQAMQAVGLDVRQLSKEARGAWKMVLRSEAGEDLQLYLGKELLEQRVERFKQLFDRELQSRAAQLEYVDLRYTNGIAIKWKADA